MHIMRLIIYNCVYIICKNKILNRLYLYFTFYVNKLTFDFFIKSFYLNFNLNLHFSTLYYKDQVAY